MRGEIHFFFTKGTGSETWALLGAFLRIASMRFCIIFLLSYYLSSSRLGHSFYSVLRHLRTRSRRWSGSLPFFARYSYDLCSSIVREFILFFYYSIPKHRLYNLTITMIGEKPKGVSSFCKQIAAKLPTCIPTLNSQPKGEELQKMVVDIKAKGGKVQTGYEGVISSLKGVIQQLLQKNKFLTQDRDTVLKENVNLKKKNQSLNNVIEVKRRLGESLSAEGGDIFEILVESGSVSGGMSKIQQSRDEDLEAEGVEQANNEAILDRNELIIASNPLSYNISRVQESQISMSNIGHTNNAVPTRVQTPGLAKENIFTQVSTRTSDGAIRAFYLSAIQKKSTSNSLAKLIDQLRHDITTVIYQPYPTNEFWTEMLCNFIKIIHQGHFQTQLEVLQYIKMHKLIDTLLIRCLKSRIQFLFEYRDSFENPTVAQILGSLANAINLRMQLCQGQYTFFAKEMNEDNLLLSERASMEISLNNKSDNKYYVNDEQPLFAIYEREQNLQLPFFITIEVDMGLSHYELNEEGMRNNQSFRYSEENNRSILEHDTEIIGQGDLDNIASILNERDLNINLNIDLPEKSLTRKIGHRRYNDSAKKSPNNYQQPLSSSRFFLNRVASKNSSIDENYL